MYLKKTFCEGIELPPEKITAIRIIDPANFSPMCRGLIEIGYLKRCVQVEVVRFGEPVWITVNYKHVIGG